MADDDSEFEMTEAEFDAAFAAAEPARIVVDRPDVGIQYAALSTSGSYRFQANIFIVPMGSADRALASSQIAKSL